VGGFCDQYNMLNSRDAEMAKGPLRDNFYCQLTANIRRFKGMTPLPAASEPKTIDLDGPLAQWDDVAPEYSDHALETLPRDFDGCGGKHYTNTTGRNDIAVMKVARDTDKVSFLATTRSPLSPITDQNWMQLLIDTDLNPATGWEGFNLLVRISNNGSATLAKWNGTAWENDAAPVCCAVGESSIQYFVPRKALCSGANLKLEFKWADNIALPCDILDFYINGDVAPAGRFRYRYKTD